MRADHLEFDALFQLNWCFAGDFYAQRRLSSGEHPLQLLNEIRRLVVALVFGRSPEPDYCRGWTSLHRDTARVQGLTPWLYKSLANHPDKGMPADIKKDLQQDYMSSVLANMNREAALKQVLETLNASNARPVLLKGAYLGHVVYEEPALRPMSDVDILVHEDNFEETRNALVSLGYEIQVEPQSAEDQALQLAEPYTLGRCQVAIDLHRSLGAMDYYRFPLPEIWDQITERRLYGCKVFFLSPEVNFIHVATHALNHGPLLRDWLDLVLILNRTAFEWDQFLRLSRSFGVMRPMWWVFGELGANWECAAPPYVTDALTAYRPHWLEDRIIPNRWGYIWRLYAKMWLLDGWTSRIRFLGSRLFPSKSYRERVTGTRNWAAYVGSKLGHFLHFWRQS